jgi:hypothetical protein
MPSAYRIAKNFPSRAGRINLTVPLSPAEYRAPKTACEVLKFSMAGLARCSLTEILAPYDHIEPAAPPRRGARDRPAAAVAAAGPAAERLALRSPGVPTRVAYR